MVIGQLAPTQPTYPQFLEAAQAVLAEWWAHGARYVSASDGRLDPCAEIEPGLPCWSVLDTDAAQLLVASVLRGHRYQGWNKALRETIQSTRGHCPGKAS